MFVTHFSRSCQPTRGNMVTVEALFSRRTQGRGLTYDLITWSRVGRVSSVWVDLDIELRFGRWVRIGSSWSVGGQLEIWILFTYEEHRTTTLKYHQTIPRYRLTSPSPKRYELSRRLNRSVEILFILYEPVVDLTNLMTSL